MKHLNEEYGIPLSTLQRAVSEGDVILPTLNTNDTTPPSFVSASTDGDLLTITFSENVFIHPLVTYVKELYNVPLQLFLRAVFDASLNGHRVYLHEYALLSGSTLTFNMAYDTGSDDEIHIAYNNIFARNAGALLVDAAGNPVPLFSNKTVQNNSPAGSSSITSGVVLNKTDLTIEEGKSGTYTVALPSQPTENVTVNVRPYHVLQVSPDALSFTTENWDVAQEVTVSTTDDADSIDAWASVLHYIVDDRSSNWSYLHVLVDDQDTPLTLSGDTTVSYSENDTSSVATYSVTDAGGRTVSWSIFGDDSSDFSIGNGGELNFRRPPDYENPDDSDTDNTYRVTVHASNGASTGVLLNVAVTVTDEVERPFAPAAPSVSASAGSATGLEVIWTAPDNTGRPAISHYDLQYSKGTSGVWTDGPQNVSGTQASVAGLDADSPYQVQVRASNADGDGEWSEPGSGMTGNTAPAFAGAGTTRSFAETVGAAAVQNAADIGAAVSATDDDGDELAYSLEGADATLFGIDRGTGQLRTVVGERYDHEAKASYAVIVKASDGNGGSATIAVTIAVTDAIEKPWQPVPPSVSGTAGSSTGLEVIWTAPDNTGRPAISHYDLQYSKGTSGVWTDGPQDVTGTSASIESLDANSAYQVRVRANNADGDGEWSEPGSGMTGNTAPAFAGAGTTRSFAETVGAAAVQNAADIGAAVSATDDDGDELAYSLEGADATLFGIDRGTGQLRTVVGERYDHEANASYAVIVKASDGNGGSATIAVTIAVTDAIEKPRQPVPPSVSGTAGSSTGLKVIWTAPDNTGRPAISHYDLQYSKGTSGVWTDGPQNVSGTQASVAGLDADSPYQVRVRASNADGDSEWSEPASGQTNAPDNAAPVFPADSATRSFAETVGAAAVQNAADIGAAVSATDDDGDELAYGLEGADAGRFGIVAGTGQIRTRAGERYDREARASYAVIVTVEDGQGGSDAVAVTIDVTDAVETPLPPPAAPSVSRVVGSSTSLDVAWTAPDNTGRPAISHYDLQYRKGTNGAWTDGPQDVTGMSAGIASLDANSAYQVRVRANNADGDGEWSEPGSGTTGRAALVPASITLSADPSEVPEGGGQATITVTARLDGAAPTVPTVVPVSVTRGTAHSGVDFASVPSFAVTIPAGATEGTATFALVPVDDAVDEGSGETVTISGTGTPFTVSPATVTLIDDDQVLTDGDPSSPDTVLGLSVAIVPRGTGATQLTAAFRDAPSEHDGETPFSFGLVFSDEVAGLSGATVLDHVLAVAGGRVTQVREAGVSAGMRWRVTLVPDGVGDVSVGLSATADCAAPGAVCTADGRRLASGHALLVRGPASLSVADASVREGANAELRFTVSLDRARGAETRVDWATSDGTAQAGSDYAAASGTAVIGPGMTSTTIRIDVLDDTVNEGSETLTLVLSNPEGARIGDGTATGTITNADPMPEAWLARFGPAVAEQVLDAIGSRLRAPRTPAIDVTLASERIGGNVAAGPQDGVPQLVERASADWFRGADPWRPRDPWVRRVTARDLLAGSSISFMAGETGDDTFALWGRGAVSRFDGRDGDLSFDGEVTSGMLGADWSRGAGTAGLVVSHSRGDGGFRALSGNGTVKSSLTGLYPWGRYALSEHVSVWGVAGYGEGTLTLTTGHRAPVRADLELAVGATGLRGALVRAPESGGIALSVKTEAMGVRTSSSDAPGLKGADAGVTRLRLGLEGSRLVVFEDEAQMTPSVEIGVRQDGGDAETGFGIDIAGGIHWSDPVHGLSAEVRGRGLLRHGSKDLRSRGFSGALTFEPMPDSPRGLKLTLNHAVGPRATAGMDAVIRGDALASLIADDNGGDEHAFVERRLELRLEYGLPAFGDRFTMVPEAGFSLGGGLRDYSLGWRLVRERPGRGWLNLSLEAMRREGTDNDDVAPEHSIGLRLRARF